MLDEISFHYKDTRKNDDVNFDINDLLKYSFNKYRTSISLNFNEVKVEDFIKSMNLLRDTRYVCGVIAYVAKNEVIAVLNSRNQVSFPKGKQDYLDNNIKKLTAFREFGEETGKWISIEQYQKCREYVDILFYDTTIRFYFLRGLEKESFNLKHKIPGEINGMKIVRLNETETLSNKTALCRNMVMFLTHGTQHKSKYKYGNDNRKSWKEYSNIKANYLAKNK